MSARASGVSATSSSLSGCTNPHLPKWLSKQDNLRKEVPRAQLLACQWDGDPASSVLCLHRSLFSTQHLGLACLPTLAEPAISPAYFPYNSIHRHRLTLTWIKKEICKQTHPELARWTVHRLPGSPPRRRGCLASAQHCCAWAGTQPALSSSHSLSAPADWQSQ